MVEHEGNPWFVATDICRALDMDLSRGAYKWLVGVEDRDRRTTTYGDLGHQNFCGAKEGRGGVRAGTKTTLLSEAGQYKMVMRSNKPDAQDFQDWIARVVLPSIRKNGGYIKDQEKVVTGEMSMQELADRH